MKNNDQSGVTIQLESRFIESGTGRVEVSTLPLDAEVRAFAQANGVNPESTKRFLKILGNGKWVRGSNWREVLLGRYRNRKARKTV